MDKNKVYEIAFKTIRDSIEWVSDESKSTYVEWVDGVATMADALIKEIDEKNSNSSLKAD